MEKRRMTSSNYPPNPHEKVDRKTGERKEGYSKGRYDRDNKNEDKYGNRLGGQGKRGTSGKGKFQGARKSSPVPQKPVIAIVSEDQITDGKHRGIQIKISESPKMSPTSGAIRETLFRILYKKVRAKRFLDLCAGTGSVGIEAISRGALIATMVERKARHCTLMRENLKSLEISEGHGEVFESEVIPFLKLMFQRKRLWDIVYFGPPRDFDYDEALEYFKKGTAVRPGGIFVIEHHSEMFFPEKIGVLTRWKVVVEDESALSFYGRKPK